MPSKVMALCQGLLEISSNFVMTHLNITFDEFTANLSAGSALFGTNEYSQQKSLLRDIERERKNIINHIIEGLEDQLAKIRTPRPHLASDIKVNIANLSLVEESNSDQMKFLQMLATRSESINNIEIHCLRQRFSVLSGVAPFSNEELPLGPHSLGACLKSSLLKLELSTGNAELLSAIVEKRFFGNYSSLLDQCNSYLANQKVLSNLGYMTYRNPDARHKKSAKASKDGSQQNNPHSNTNHPRASQEKHFDARAKHRSTPAQSNNPPNYTLENFRELLAQKKHQFHQLDTIADVTSTSETANTVPASREIVLAALNGLQRNESGALSSAPDIQSIKRQLQLQLNKQSSSSATLTLAPEENDAIDIIDMLMNSAAESFKPNSATSQIMNMLQAPILKVALQDKTFFENKDHPARKMLDAIAVTSMNWLDVADRDEKLYSSIVNIVSDISDSSSNSNLQSGYDETNRLLQALIKKADAIERRQIEIAKGKERLDVARTRAEKTIEALISGRALTPFTKSMLLNAWADVLVLTELRHGNDSSNWLTMKETTESIIAAGDLASTDFRQEPGLELSTRIQESLQLVGFHTAEAEAASTQLLLGKNNNSASLPNIQKTKPIDEPQKIIPSKPVFKLNNHQIALMQEIKTLPFGTWFEFQGDDKTSIERLKMAWASHTTHHVLFVNSRGQRVSDMLIEELAIAMSAGTARIPKVDTRGFIERAFDSAFSSLKTIMPGKSGNEI